MCVCLSVCLGVGVHLFICLYIWEAIPKFNKSKLNSIVNFGTVHCVGAKFYKYCSLASKIQTLKMYTNTHPIYICKILTKNNKDKN